MFLINFKKPIKLVREINQIEIMELLNLFTKVKKKRQLSKARAVKRKLIMLLQGCRYLVFHRKKLWRLGLRVIRINLSRLLVWHKNYILLVKVLRKVKIILLLVKVRKNISLKILSLS